MIGRKIIKKLPLPLLLISKMVTFTFEFTLASSFWTIGIVDVVTMACGEIWTGESVRLVKYYEK